MWRRMRKTISKISSGKLRMRFSLILMLLASSGLARVQADDSINRSADIRPSQMTVTTFIVPTDYFQIKPDMGTKETKQKYNVAPHFIAMGALFQPGTSAVYLPAFKKLIVNNTFDQIELIDELLNASFHPMIFVTKKTKFVEIHQ